MGTFEANWLVYDIPETSGYPNPTRWLLPLAIRVNKSCWVIMKADIPWNRLNLMKQCGVNYHVVPFAPEAAQEILAMAVANIRRDLREAVTRARLSINRANRQLDAAEEAGDEARQRYERDARAVINRAKKLIRDIKASAAKFGITDSTINLADAASSVALMQSATHQRAKLYADACTELSRVMGRTDPMARAASADHVPAGIVADYMDDHEIDGAPLRDAHR